MQNRVVMFLCCAVIISGGVSCLLTLHEGGGQSARQGVAILMILLAGLRLWTETKKPVR